MVGSAQNIALPNIVLNTAVAKVLRDYANRLEKCYDRELEAKKIIKEGFTRHRRIIFNGNGYSKEWPIEAEKRGLLNFKCSVDAYPSLTNKKNIDLFTSFGVMSEIELYARKEIMFETYSKTIAIEARTMSDIAICNVIPAIERYICYLGKTAKFKNETVGEGFDRVERDIIKKLSELSLGIYSTANELSQKRENAASEDNAEAVAYAYKNSVIPLMSKLRELVDSAEVIMPPDMWPMPDYGALTYWY